jgi:pimeloyl-ACP methyl ester carboxylesterase
MESITHLVSSAGPAQGMTFTGRRSKAANADVPLVIALHGGGYTSAYFDVPGYSLLERAATLGMPLIAVDRPGYGGSTPVPPGVPLLDANAALLDHLIGELWAEYGTSTAGVVVIGHSIGACVTLAMAARRPQWPLLGVAVSGCLLHVPDHFGGAWATSGATTLESPAEQKAARMFGPDWTRRDDMPQAAYFANVPVLTAELVESATTWPDTYRRIAPAITVPVHLRLGEYDKLWLHDDAQLASFAAALTGSPSVDATIFPAAGHAIDYHRGGPAFQLQQLSFALTGAAARIREPEA